MRVTIVFAADEQVGYSPQVRRMVIGDAATGQVVATADIKAVSREAGLKGGVPTNLELAWPQQQASLALDLGEPTVNPQFTPKLQTYYFTRRDMGVEPIDLTRVQFRGSARAQIAGRRRSRRAARRRTQALGAVGDLIMGGCGVREPGFKRPHPPAPSPRRREGEPRGSCEARRGLRKQRHCVGLPRGSPPLRLGEGSLKPRLAPTHAGQTPATTTPQPHTTATNPAPRQPPRTQCPAFASPGLTLFSKNTSGTMPSAVMART